MGGPKHGVIIMIGASIAIFMILKGAIGIVYSAIVSIFIFILWSVFNYRSATKGLFKSNMFAYFVKRLKGSSHEAALEWVIISRYPYSEEKQNNVRRMFNAMRIGLDEESDIKTLVFVIFCNECGQPPTLHATYKILNKIDKVYESMERKYKINFA